MHGSVRPRRARLSVRRSGGAGTGERRLGDLESVGPATLRDLSMLGIATVEHLARCDAEALYAQLCRAKGVRVDPCCEDVFSAAIAQARDPHLAPGKRKWWFWSPLRKQRALGARKGDAQRRRGFEAAAPGFKAT